MNKVKLLTMLALASGSVAAYAGGPDDMQAPMEEDCVRDLKGGCIPAAPPEPVAEEPMPEPTPVVEVEPSWYVALMAGQATYKDACEDDDNDTALSAAVGYMFNPNFGIEGGYTDLGSIDSEVGNCVQAQPIDPSADGINISLVGRAPVSERVAVYGKLGAFAWNMDREDVSDDGVSPTAGIGVGVGFTDSIEGRLEYNRYFDVGESDTTGQTDIDAIMAGVAIKF